MRGNVLRRPAFYHGPHGKRRMKALHWASA
jgi:hypothetical protein